LYVPFWGKTYLEQQAHNLCVAFYVGLEFTQILFIGLAFIISSLLKVILFSPPISIDILSLRNRYSLVAWHICRRQIMIVYRSHVKNFKRVIIMGDIDRYAEF
jgi:hypothetical protein